MKEPDFYAGGERDLAGHVRARTPNEQQQQLPLRYGAQHDPCAKSLEQKAE